MCIGRLRGSDHSVPVRIQPSVQDIFINRGVKQDRFLWQPVHRGARVNTDAGIHARRTGACLVDFFAGLGGERQMRLLAAFELPADPVTAGQAAGTAAALTEDFSEMDIGWLQQTLKNGGVVLHERELGMGKL